MAGVWTAPTTRATDDIVTSAQWNELLGGTGALLYLYESLRAKYKAVTQQFTTNTTYADITATSGNLAFDIGANETWFVRYFLPLAFGGTGGAKAQLTGPASPTRVSYITTGDYRTRTEHDVTTPSDTYTTIRSALQRGASTSFGAVLGAISDVGGTAAGLVDGEVVIEVMIVNGSTAGTVTLQGAQNSSNSTTDFGAGCRMLAERIG